MKERSEETCLRINPCLSKKTARELISIPNAIHSCYFANKAMLIVFFISWGQSSTALIVLIRTTNNRRTALWSASFWKIINRIKRVHYVHKFLLTHWWKLQLLHKVTFNCFQLLQSPYCLGLSLHSAYEHHYQFLFISKLVLGIRGEWKKWDS